MQYSPFTFIALRGPFLQNYFTIFVKCVRTSLTDPVHTECRGTPGRVIYGTTVPTVPIGTTNMPRHLPEGACPACPSLNPAAHNFSSFHFQEAIRPVLKSSDRALCHEYTSSLVRSSARKKNLDQLKTTVHVHVGALVVVRRNSTAVQCTRVNLVPHERVG